jgi:hypothetical protein
MLTSCRDSLEENYYYAPPEIITDYNGEVFYTIEYVQMKWILPAEEVQAGIQNIISKEPLSEREQTKVFNEADPSKLQTLYISNELYSLSFDMLEEPRYLYLRFRTEGRLGVSEWTKPINFSFRPVSELKVIPISASVNVNFTSVENNDYYSGIAESHKINLDSILQKNTIQPDELKIIRPTTGYIEFHEETEEAPFDRLAIGFSEIADEPFSFTVIADTYPPGFFEGEIRDPELKFYHRNGTKYINDLRNENMKLAYFLNDPPGKNYTMTVNFDMNCYVKK